MSDLIDLFVIGGGINGAGIARDAAGRGLSVVLCEKDDLAQGTSSRSGKLVHGGLRYLEYYEFRLVREALIEREVLMNSACHIIWPMRFVLPQSPQDRPAWLVRFGLFLYDHLGGRKKLPGTRSLDLHRDPEGAPILDQFGKGFEYSDCWVDDARLVVVNALGAAEKGATILTRTEAVSARRDDGVWAIETRNQTSGEKRSFRARCIVNAAGPWVMNVIGGVADAKSTRNVRLVKGSHIIVPKFWKGEQAYLVQNHDKRVIFINPYEGDMALIGTTDIAYEGRIEDVKADEAEIVYLIAAVNRYFKEKLRRGDVLHSFSGVRPLFDDGKGNPSAVTRDYVFDLDETGGAPLLNIFGGKITTFRELAERAMHKLSGVFPNMGSDWTRDAKLPGGEIRNADYEAFVDTLRQTYPWMERQLILHYGRLYGSRTGDVVAGAQSIDGLGKHFGGLLYEAEVRYLLTREWAQTAEDVLNRRTKHYLHLSDAERDTFSAWLDKANAPDRKAHPEAQSIMTLTLSINTNPLVNRFADADDLIQTVARDLRIRDLQLTHEFINPSWPAPVINRLTRQMSSALRRTGVRVTSGMTGPYGRLNHFGHPDRDVRRYYLEWFKTFADIIGELGGASVGTQFAIFTYKDYDDPQRREELISIAIDCWAELAEHAKSAGLSFVFWEPMSIGREFGETIAECLALQKRLTSANMAVPMWMMADIDHGDVTSANPDDYDPYAWARAVPPVSPIIHIKQSLMDKGGHRPFVAEFNAKGRIQPQQLLAAFAQGGTRDNEICLELSFKEREPNDREVIPQIAESVAFWAPHIATGARDLNV